jgi:ketosteroid isomerase-like protein
MSQENVEIVREAYERAARGDFGGFFDPVTEDFVFITSPEVPDAGTYRGEAAIEWIRAWIGSFDELTIEATELIDAGDKVLVGILQKGRSQGSPQPVEGCWWQVATFRGDAISRAQLFSERAQALEAAGLSE